MNTMITENNIAQGLQFFIAALVELTILFIAISFIVGCINELLPRQKVKKLLAGRKGRGYFIGAALGGLTPFCSCSTIPMMVGLLKAGAGFGPTMSFLFASPLVNPVLIGLFWTLLGGRITLVYAILGLGFAVFSGIILQRAGFEKYVKEEVFQQGEGSCGCSSASDVQEISHVQPAHTIMGLQPAPLSAPDGRGAASGPTQTVLARTKLREGWYGILKESVKQFRTFFPYILFGVTIGALIHGFVPASLVTQLAGSDNPLAIPVSAVIGIPLYVRAAAMVPMAASLLGKGMSVGAIIALIIGGAGASLPEVAMLKGLFRVQLLIAFLSSVFITAVVSGYIMNVVV